MVPRGDKLLTIVAEDLDYLMDEWNESTSEGSLRRGSVTLRRLLVDNELQLAWKQLGNEKEPVVYASTLEERTRGIDHRRIGFAAAGGEVLNGVRMFGAMSFNFAMTEAEMNAMIGSHTFSEERMALSSFRESTCLILNGTCISRRHVVKYVANKLGGAHFDRGRKDDSEGRVFKRLDAIAEEYRVAARNPIFYALLATGQAIANSADVLSLRAAMKLD